MSEKAKSLKTLHLHIGDASWEIFQRGTVFQLYDAGVDWNVFKRVQQEKDIDLFDKTQREEVFKWLYPDYMDFYIINSNQASLTNAIKKYPAFLNKSFWTAKEGVAGFAGKPLEQIKFLKETDVGKMLLELLTKASEGGVDNVLITQAMAGGSSGAVHYITQYRDSLGWGEGLVTVTSVYPPYKEKDDPLNRVLASKQSAEQFYQALNNHDIDSVMVIDPDFAGQALSLYGRNPIDIDNVKRTWKILLRDGLNKDTAFQVSLNCLVSEQQIDRLIAKVQFPLYALSVGNLVNPPIFIKRGSMWDYRNIKRVLNESVIVPSLVTGVRRGGIWSKIRSELFPNTLGYVDSQLVKGFWIVISEPRDISSSEYSFVARNLQNTFGDNIEVLITNITGLPVGDLWIYYLHDKEYMNKLKKKFGG